MRFASKSAIESASSANCGSRSSSGLEPLGPVEARKEEREEGRRGVVGRDATGLRGREWEDIWLDIVVEWKRGKGSDS